MPAVSNTAPLIHLARIDRLDLLGSLFDDVLVPEAVVHEAFRPTVARADMALLRQALEVGLFRVRPVQRPIVGVFPHGLGLGEIEAILLAEEISADFIILDDLSARGAAKRRNLNVTGTAGILLEARRRGLVAAAYPLLEELVERGFRASDRLLTDVRRQDNALGE